MESTEKDDTDLISHYNSINKNKKVKFLYCIGKKRKENSTKMS